MEKQDMQQVFSALASQYVAMFLSEENRGALLLELSKDVMFQSVTPTTKYSRSILTASNAVELNILLMANGSKYNRELVKALSPDVEKFASSYGLGGETIVYSPLPEKEMLENLTESEENNEEEEEEEVKEDEIKESEGPSLSDLAEEEEKTKNQIEATIDSMVDYANQSKNTEVTKNRTSSAWED